MIEEQLKYNINLKNPLVFYDCQFDTMILWSDVVENDYLTVIEDKSNSVLLEKEQVITLIEAMEHPMMFFLGEL